MVVKHLEAWKLVDEKITSLQDVRQEVHDGQALEGECESEVWAVWESMSFGGNSGPTRRNQLVAGILAPHVFLAPHGDVDARTTGNGRMAMVEGFRSEELKGDLNFDCSCCCARCNEVHLRSVRGVMRCTCARSVQSASAQVQVGDYKKVRDGTYSSRA